METDTLMKVILTGLWALIGLGWAALPAWKGPDAFFGVPVSEEYFHSHEARRRLRSFQMVAAVCAMVSMAGVWRHALLTAVGVYAVIIAMVLGYLLTRPHRVTTPKQAAAASLRPRSRWLYVRPGLEAISLAAVLASLAYLGSLYASPPLELPHAPAELTAATNQLLLWAAQVVTFLQVQIFLVGLLLLMGMAQARAILPDPPSDRYLELRESYMRLMADLLYAMKLCLLACLALTAPSFMWGARHGDPRAIAFGLFPPEALRWGTVPLIVANVLLLGAIFYYLPSSLSEYGRLHAFGL